MGRITDPIGKFFQAYKDGLILSSPLPPEGQYYGRDDFEDVIDRPHADEARGDRPFIPFN